MALRNSPKAVGVGLIALDLVVGPDSEVLVGCWAGGTCGNVLAILAYLGWDTYPIARMNGDEASRRICEDMARWGVHLDWASCAPTTHAPIVVQKLLSSHNGQTRHRFSWSCPNCGERLPPARMVTVEAVDKVRPVLADASVFFLDRLSRSNLILAAEASAHGAVVVFEPSSRANSRQMEEALALAHIVKYADSRRNSVPDIVADGSSVLVEVQTLGERGLRYRHRLGRQLSDWMYLKAVSAHRLTDTCGSGDWCTAGLIAKTAFGGQDGLHRAGARGVRSALRYGQALAAWNCGFEGARGGMYAVTQQEFEIQIASLLSGQLGNIKETSVRSGWAHPVSCPACPSESF